MLSSDKKDLYAIFHLNLAFSSIDEDQHGAAIERCYWPLLRLIEDQQVPLGLEITLYTLECIERVDPQWVQRFKELLHKGRCELIASGDSQIIGPLVPVEVNRWNLALGQQGYREILGVTPNLAFINEQAVSPGVLDVYADAGFNAVVIEWDNPASHNADWPREAFWRPGTLMSAKGQSVKVIWNSAVAFQKFQRYAHQDITLDDYLDALRHMTRSACCCFPLYGSDAEVFDYRPGRYSAEAECEGGEWNRLIRLFERLSSKEEYRWILPRDALLHWREDAPLSLSNPQYPISVKKQAKYNVTRWALSGRNDLALNSLCFQRFNILKRQPDQNGNDWQDLCRLWASDFRTHLTQRRYEQLLSDAPLKDTSKPEESSFVPDLPEGVQIDVDQERKHLHLKTDTVSLVVNLKRGMSIVSLGFAEQGFEPIIGTHFHGHFEHIGFSADFYSNHLVVERFRERDRVTDLQSVEWRTGQKDGDPFIMATLETPIGRIRKYYRIQHERIECGFDFVTGQRPEASVRLGFLTLADCKLRPWFACHNGGETLEFVSVDEDIDHGKPVSSIVSASAALGATTGECFFGSGDRGVRVTWHPSECAALPMVCSYQVNHAYLNRMWFSLVESDETLKSGGQLPGFRFELQPWSAEKHNDGF